MVGSILNEGNSSAAKKVVVSFRPSIKSLIVSVRNKALRMYMVRRIVHQTREQEGEKEQDNNGKVGGCFAVIKYFK